MTYIELKKALIELLQSKFPTTSYTYYSMATEENYKRPSFFTYLRPVEVRNDNYNCLYHLVQFNITYLQAKVDEQDILDKIYEIEQLFGLAVMVGERAVDVVEYSWDYIGSQSNVASITINLEWSDAITHSEPEDKMETLSLNEYIELED